MLFLEKGLPDRFVIIGQVGCGAKGPEAAVADGRADPEVVSKRLAIENTSYGRLQ